MCECDYYPERRRPKGDVVTAPVARSPRNAPHTARDATTRRRGDGDPHYSQAQKPPGPRFMTLGSRSMSSASSIFRSCSTPHQRHAHDQPQTWRTVIIGRKKIAHYYYYHYECATRWE